MSAQGRPSVSRRKDARSVIVLVDTNGGFSDRTMVTDPIKDEKKTWEWTPVRYTHNKNGTRLTIVVKLKKVTKPFDDTDLESGSLSVTLTNGPSVDPVPVDYVDDDPCA